MKTFALVAFAGVVLALGAAATWAGGTHSVAAVSPCDFVDVSKTIDCGSGLRAEVACWVDGTDCGTSGARSGNQRVVSLSVIFNYKQVLLRHQRFNGLVQALGSEPLVVASAELDLEVARLFAAEALGLAYEPDDRQLVSPGTITVRPASGLNWSQVLKPGDIEIDHSR